MPKYIKSLKRVISDGNNGKTLEEYDFAVKAENVIVTTADGNETNVNNALMQLTEPTTFVLDNNAQSWYENNHISWEMICDSLKNNTIQNYLKVGDEIDIPIGNDETLSFFVLGINTYNGQPKDQFGKTHIDLGCPQMSKILSILDAYRPDPSSPLKQYFPFGNVSDNNGGIINNETYLTFFSKSNFRAMNNYYKATLISNILQIVDDDLKKFIQPKVLFLDKRLGIKDELFTDLTQLFPNNTSSLYSDLLDLYSKIPSPLPVPEEVSETITNEVTITLEDETETTGTITTSEEKEINYPIEGEGSWNNFYEAAKSFLGNHANSRTVMIMQQHSINLIKNFVLEATGIKSWGEFALAVQQATIYLYNAQKIIELMSNICTVMIQDYEITKYSNDYVRIFNNDVNDPSPLFWGLTEYELFGSCILGDKKYSQGQSFQYPIFRNLLNKEKFVGANKEIKDFATITPVDGSSNELVGCRTKEDNEGNLLCARPVALPTYDPTSTTYSYDTALCFRLQA